VVDRAVGRLYDTGVLSRHARELVTAESPRPPADERFAETVAEQTVDDRVDATADEVTDGGNERLRILNDIGNKITMWFSMKVTIYDIAPGWRMMSIVVVCLYVVFFYGW